jgi:tetratricopeptide (TPR) repeat protein
LTVGLFSSTFAATFASSHRSIMSATDTLSLAVQALQARRLAEAARLCERVLAEEPGRADALKILSGVRFMEGRLDEALAYLQRAATLDPRDPKVHANLGSILTRLHRPEEAVVCYQQALALAPDYAEAHYNLGATLAALDRPEEALACYDKVLALMPNHGRALINRGSVLSALNRHEEAIACYDRVLKDDPQYAEAETNRGTALQWLNRVDEAIARYDTALAARPEDAVAHWNKGLAALYRGDFATGWSEYEWRWRKPDFAIHRRNYPQPHWRGESAIVGKTILIFSEQGLGDVIQFCRYAPLLADRDATVLLEVQASLKPLLKSLRGVTQVFAKGEPLPPFDLQCPVMSLPLAFRTDAASIPADVPYLAPSAEATALWKDKLGARTKPRIGLAWSGNPGQQNDRNRSMRLADLAPLIGDERFEFHVLQNEIRDADRATLTAFPALRVHAAPFDDTAAIIDALDLTISVDTSILHLAGALARPAWGMLTFSPDWRWLMERSDSPWYPTVRLFRQTAVGDWDGVVAQVRAALESL